MKVLQKGPLNQQKISVLEAFTCTLLAILGVYDKTLVGLQFKLR